MSTDQLLNWKQIKGLERSKLDVLLAHRRESKAAIEMQQEALNDLNNKILTVLAAADVKSVEVSGARVTLVPGGKSEVLDKKVLWGRLLELGVKEKVVVQAYADATEMKERAPSIRVTEAKDDEE